MTGMPKWYLNPASTGGWLLLCEREGWRKLQAHIHPEADADRILVSMNACEVLEDPSVVPELLAALERVEDWLSSFSMPPTSTIDEKQAHLDMIRAVIAKAEGKR